MQSVNDISFWQDTADFRKMSQLSSGVILRAGQGTWEDRRFQVFRKDAREILPFGNYWYYDAATPPKRQAEKWAEIIGVDHGALGCWLDLEDARVSSYNNYHAWWDCVAYFKQFQPSAVLGIYTRASYFNDPTWGVPENHAFRNLPLWIAQYKTSKPNLPKGWNEWLLWQWTDEGDGIAHGVGSKEIDMNWYNGDIVTPKVSHMTAKFGNVEVQYMEKK